jgi:hypothetical protein
VLVVDGNGMERFVSPRLPDTESELPNPLEDRVASSTYFARVIALIDCDGKLRPRETTVSFTTADPDFRSVMSAEVGNATELRGLVPTDARTGEIILTTPYDTPQHLHGGGHRPPAIYRSAYRMKSTSAYS